MTPADRRFAQKVFSLCGYDQFTNANDAVRIATAGPHGELLAIHKEDDAFKIYLRRGGKDVTELRQELQSLVSFDVLATHDALAIRVTSPAKVQDALSQLVSALPAIFDSVSDSE